MNRTNNYLTLILGKIIQARRNTGAQSPQQFAEAYLQYHCNLPFSRMQPGNQISLLKPIILVIQYYKLLNEGYETLALLARM